MKNISESKKQREKEEKQQIESYRQFEEEMGFFDRIILFGLPIVLFILFALIMFKVLYNYLLK